MSIRRSYSRAFKEDAVSLVIEQSYSCAEAARSLDINANILSRWVRESREKAGEAFPGNGKLTAEQLEIRCLREENKRLISCKRLLQRPVEQAPGATARRTA